MTVSAASPHLIPSWLLAAAALLLVGVVFLFTRQVQEQTGVISPDHAAMHYQLGRFHMHTGQLEKAIESFSRTLANEPESFASHTGLGTALAALGRFDEARNSLETALRLEPGHAEALRSLGYVLMQQGHIAEACEHFRQSLLTEPDDISALNNLAWMLATSAGDELRDGQQAVAYAGKALEVKGAGHPTLLMTLAAAHAEAGQFSEAALAAERGIALARESSNPPLAETLQAHLALYRNRQPLRMPASPH